MKITLTRDDLHLKNKSIDFAAITAVDFLPKLTLSLVNTAAHIEFIDGDKVKILKYKN